MNRIAVAWGALIVVAVVCVAVVLTREIVRENGLPVDDWPFAEDAEIISCNLGWWEGEGDAPPLVSTRSGCNYLYVVLWEQRLLLEEASHVSQCWEYMSNWTFALLAEKQTKSLVELVEETHYEGSYDELLRESRDQIAESEDRIDRHVDKKECPFDW